MSCDYFDDALRMILKHEGGYANDPNDHGGATNYGISLKFLKGLNYVGKSLLGDMDEDGDIDIEDIKKMTPEVAGEIYRSQWWDRYGYGKIENRLLAIKLMDISVNIGPHRAHIILQQTLFHFCSYNPGCLRKLQGIVKNRIIVDGNFGPISQGCTNFCDEKYNLLSHFQSLVCSFYRGLNQPRFEKGWINRAMDLDI